MYNTWTKLSGPRREEDVKSGDLCPYGVLSLKDLNLDQSSTFLKVLLGYKRRWTTKILETLDPGIRSSLTDTWATSAEGVSKLSLLTNEGQ